MNVNENRLKLGIIGGSGLDDPQFFDDIQIKHVGTKYGRSSSAVVCGKLSGVDVCIIARHGKKHTIPPHKINYRANIQALKEQGCTHIIATSAVGSLREQIRPGDLVFPDQFLDFTKKRINSFYDETGRVEHTPMSEPFSASLRRILINTADKLKMNNHGAGTIVVVEGPRFSTRAESQMFRQLGADVIGMTTVPECTLAKEAGLEYAVVSMTTDYDCWKQDEEPVSWDMIKQRMKENAGKVMKLIGATIPNIAELR